MRNGSQIVIYQTEDGKTKLDVLLENETVWLTQKMMAELFQTTSQNITIHIKNIYTEGELEMALTCKESLQVQKEGNRTVEREQKIYNLDVIISVGYRVKSLRGTQFRIWANQILKDFLIKGFALNEKLLTLQKEKLSQLNSAIKMISSVNADKSISDQDRDSFLNLLEKYSEALNIIDNYDYKRFIDITPGDYQIYILQYEEVKKIIDQMKSKFSESKYFGKEKDASLYSSISAIYQTFDGVDLYPSIEEKSANLLYFLVKNHTFVDGNKRIAAAVFLYFLDKNKYLDNIALENGMLVALTLMIANSKPSDKDILINIIAILLKDVNKV